MKLEAKNEESRTSRGEKWSWKVGSIYHSPWVSHVPLFWFSKSHNWSNLIYPYRSYYQPIPHFKIVESAGNFLLTWTKFIDTKIPHKEQWPCDQAMTMWRKWHIGWSFRAVKLVERKLRTYSINNYCSFEKSTIINFSHDKLDWLFILESVC